MVNTDTGGSEVSEIRTSKGTFLERGEDPVIEGMWGSPRLGVGLRVCGVAGMQRGPPGGGLPGQDRALIAAMPVACVSLGP